MGHDHRGLRPGSLVDKPMRRKVTSHRLGARPISLVAKGTETAEGRPPPLNHAPPVYRLRGGWTSSRPCVQLGEAERLRVKYSYRLPRNSREARPAPWLVAVRYPVA